MEDLKVKLLEDCNSSGLPLEAILFVVRDLYRDVEDTYRNFKTQQEKEKEDKE
jgi:hypothetical protein